MGLISIVARRVFVVALTGVGAFAVFVVLLVLGGLLWANLTPDPEAKAREQAKEAQRLDGYTADHLNDAAAEWPAEVAL